MIKENERAFVHQSSVGDLGNCEEVFKVISNILKKLYYEDKRIRGYRIYIVQDQARLNSKFIDWCDYAAVTQGNFPFIYAAIQPFDEAPESFNDLMEPLGYVPCAPKPIGEDILSSPENKAAREYIHQLIREHKREKVLE